MVAANKLCAAWSLVVLGDVKHNLNPFCWGSDMRTGLMDDGHFAVGEKPFYWVGLRFFGKLGKVQFGTGSCVHPLAEVANGNVERAGDAQHGLDAGVAHPAFDAADVGAVEVRLFGERVLREAALVADSGDVAAERIRVLSVVSPYASYPS